MIQPGARSVPAPRAATIRLWTSRTGRPRASRRWPAAGSSTSVAGPGATSQADAHALPFSAATFDTVFANRMLNAAGQVDAVLGEIVRVLAPGGSLVVLTRARPAQGADRLDPENGADRLRGYFESITVQRAADTAIFVATTRRVR
ncbi:MAG: class I SAM-dependent methyltransferase [Candidatus Limnocylindria bacterium]